MSDQHAKEAYMKGLTLDVKLEKPVTQVESNSKNIDQLNSSSNIQLQLLQRLARGEISQEVYLQAISSLKSNTNLHDFSCY